LTKVETHTLPNVCYFNVCYFNKRFPVIWRKTSRCVSLIAKFLLGALTLFVYKVANYRKI
jgi:hypothetical protein